MNGQDIGDVNFRFTMDVPVYVRVLFQEVPGCLFVTTLVHKPSACCLSATTFIAEQLKSQRRSPRELFP